MKISVIIPVTREKIVEKCVEALSKQIRMPDEIIFIVPYGWEKLRKLLKGYISRHHLSKARIVWSYDKKQMSMLNKGIEKSIGEILAFTDDDGAPFPDWLERIGKYFEHNPDVGGVGGKDIFVPSIPGLNENPKAVGKITFYGRMIGHHSEWNSGPVEVDHIKGCNMSFRKDAFSKFNEDLLGNQHGNEIDVSLRVKKKGYKVIYDPDILIYHYIDVRPEIWEGKDFKDKIYVSIFNHTLVALKNFTECRKFVFILYSFIIGQKINPGILEFLILLKKSRRMIQAIPYIISGKTSAIKHYLRTKKVVYQKRKVYEITILSHSFDRKGGQNKVTYEVVRRLADWGIKINLIGLSIDKLLMEHPNIKFFKIYIPFTKPDLLEHLLLYIFSVPSLIRHRRGPLLTTGVISLYSPSIVVLHFLNLSWRKIFKKLGISHLRDYYHYIDIYIGALAERFLLRRAGVKIITVSEGVKRDVMMELPEKREDISVIYNGVDNKRFSPRYRIENREILFGNGVKKNDILVGYAGDLKVKRKGVDILIKSFERIPNNYKLVLIGKGNPYRRYGIEKPFRKKIIWIDFTEELAKYLANLDIFVLPSYYEPFGLVALESMASGVPVILSYNAGISELLKDKKNVLFLYNPGDVEELRKKIMLLMEDVKLRKTLSRNGIKIARSLSWEESAKDAYKFILKILSR